MTLTCGEGGEPGQQTTYIKTTSDESRVEEARSHFALCSPELRRAFDAAAARHRAIHGPSFEEAALKPHGSLVQVDYEERLSGFEAGLCMPVRRGTP